MIFRQKEEERAGCFTLCSCCHVAVSILCLFLVVPSVVCVLCCKFVKNHAHKFKQLAFQYQCTQIDKSNSVHLLSRYRAEMEF